MSDRIYFREGARLTEAMLNDSFGYLEESAQRLLTSLGVRGIIRGLTVVPHDTDEMSVVVQPGLAFDRSGRRIEVREASTVPLTQASDGARIHVEMPGCERWLALYLRFARRDGKPYLDKENHVVATCAYEWFEVVIRAGLVADVGKAEKPTVGPDEVHLCDVRIPYGKSRVTSDCIDTSRLEPFRLTHANAIAEGSLGTTSVQDALARIQNDLQGQAHHLAHLVDGSRWEALPARHSVQEALDEVDAALVRQAHGLAGLVDGSGWQSLPPAATAQAALDSIDRAIGETRGKLHELSAFIDSLRFPSARAGAQTAFALFAYNFEAQLPPLGPNRTWVAGFATSVRKEDRAAFVVPTSDADNRVRATPQQCDDGVVRVAFTNTTSEALGSMTYKFAVYVAEMA